MARTIKLALVPGDGIGAEVVPEAQRVVEAILPEDVKLDAVGYDLGANRYVETGETLPDTVLDELRRTDAILLGSVGDPRVPPGVLERGLLLRLRFAFEHYVNLRPIRLYPGVPCPLVGVEPDDIDMIVVREGTEGPYVGGGGVLRKGTPHEVATQDSYNTAYGVERVARYAFDRAQAGPRKHLTLVHKTNVLSYAGDLWRRTVDKVAGGYPDVTVEYQHVDAASMYFVSEPQRFDVVLTDNLFGDILTDLGAAIAGGIGLAASGNVNPQGTYPSMFEPVHGSAPDIAGQGKADPTATILSAALMLEHLGYAEQAQRIERAVGRDIAERGSEWQARSTQEVGMDIAELAAAS